MIMLGLPIPLVMIDDASSLQCLQCIGKKTKSYVSFSNFEFCEWRNLCNFAVFVLRYSYKSWNWSSHTYHTLELLLPGWRVLQSFWNFFLFISTFRIHQLITYRLNRCSVNLPISGTVYHPLIVRVVCR